MQVRFCQAIVKQVDFFGANLMGADFTDADLEGAAIPLSCEGFRDVLHSSRAIFGLFGLFLEARVASDEDQAAIHGALRALASRTSYLFRR